MSMNISQLFVTKRPIAWTAMISVLVWGIYAYLMMPQRQDPIIPVVTGVILTPYPGAEAEKVEQEVTEDRRMWRRTPFEHFEVDHPPGMSIARGAVRTASALRARLADSRQPSVRVFLQRRQSHTRLNNYFGDSFRLLTIPHRRSRPEIRACRTSAKRSPAHRKKPPEDAERTVDRVLVYPSTSHAPTSSYGQALPTPD